MIRMPGAPYARGGQVGWGFSDLTDLGPIIKDGLQVVGAGIECVMSDGTNGCQTVIENAQAIYDDAKAAAGPAFVAPAGTPTHVLEQGRVTDFAAQMASQCDSPLCKGAVVKTWLYSYQPYIEALKQAELSLGKPVLEDADILDLEAQYGDDFKARVTQYAQDTINAIKGGTFTQFDPAAMYLAVHGTPPPAAASPTGNGVCAPGWTSDGHGGCTPPGIATTATDLGTGSSGGTTASDGPGLATYLVGGTLAAAAAWSAWRLYKHQPIVPAGVKRAFR